MKKLIVLCSVFVLGFALTGCQTEANPCGEGTTLVDNVCVLNELLDDENNTEEPVYCEEGETLVGSECEVLEDIVQALVDEALEGVELPNTTVCTTETGLHTVPGGKPYTISSWLNWTFIGGHLVTDPDNAWIQDFGAAVFNVHTVAPEAWQGSFTTSGMFLEEGCEYTFEFTLRTEAPDVKPDVIVFGENTSGVSFFEEVVPLTTSTKTFRFTVTPTTSDYVSTGVYFGGSRGMVIIEEVQINRYPIGTNE